jgi:hypothetical protein
VTQEMLSRKDCFAKAVIKLGKGVRNKWMTGIQLEPFNIL